VGEGREGDFAVQDVLFGLAHQELARDQLDVVRRAQAA
jgi:hypothetical protein